MFGGLRNLHFLDALEQEGEAQLLYKTEVRMAKQSCISAFNLCRCIFEKKTDHGSDFIAQKDTFLKYNIKFALIILSF
jgi:hypothetical protein